MMERRDILIALLVLLAPAAGLAEVPKNPPGVLPEAAPKIDRDPDHYDWRYAEQLRDFADRIQNSMVRLERTARKGSPLETDRVVDGVGVVIAAGRVVTPSKWLEGAKTIWVVVKDERIGEAKVLARDEEAGLLLLSFVPPEAVELKPVRGFAPLPLDEPTELVYPTSVGRESSAGVNRGVALREAEGTFVGGVLRNGVPGFDGEVRVRVLCLQPTPERARSLAIDGGVVATFLEAQAPEAPAPKKTDPAP